MSKNASRALVALLALGINGCAAPLKKLDANQTTINPDMYVVALSFDSSALAADISDGNDRLLGYARLHWSRAPGLVTGNNETGVYAIMLESAKPTFNLGDLELIWKTGRYRNVLYKSATSGPIVDLEPGVITYVGSVVIKWAKFDTRTGEPISVTMTIEDAWENHVELWKNDYPIMLAHDPIRRIAPVWGDAGQVALKRVKPAWSSRDYSPHDYNPRPKDQPVVSDSQNPRNQ